MEFEKKSSNFQQNLNNIGNSFWKKKRQELKENFQKVSNNFRNSGKMLRKFC